jgi:hypothetical protein
MIVPVTFWCADATKMKPKDHLMLVNYFKELSPLG